MPFFTVKALLLLVLWDQAGVLLDDEGWLVMCNRECGHYCLVSVILCVCDSDACVRRASGAQKSIGGIWSPAK